MGDFLQNLIVPCHTGWGQRQTQSHFDALSHYDNALVLVADSLSEKDLQATTICKQKIVWEKVTIAQKKRHYELVFV